MLSPSTKGDIRSLADSFLHPMQCFMHLLWVKLMSGTVYTVDHASLDKQVSKPFVYAAILTRKECTVATGPQEAALLW